MTSRRIAMLLLASALGVAPAFGQTAAEPAPKQAGTPTHPRAKALHAKAPSANEPRAKKPARPSGRAAAAPAAPSPILGSGDAAASLERRRKAFFAPKPDEGGAEADAPSAGVTLGGSGGISPGMGFKF